MNAPTRGLTLGHRCPAERNRRSEGMVTHVPRRPHLSPTRSRARRRARTRTGRGHGHTQATRGRDANRAAQRRLPARAAAPGRDPTPPHRTPPGPAPAAITPRRHQPHRPAITSRPNGWPLLPSRRSGAATGRPTGPAGPARPTTAATRRSPTRRHRPVNRVLPSAGQWVAGGWWLVAVGGRSVAARRSTARGCRLGQRVARGSPPMDRCSEVVEGPAGPGRSTGRSHATSPWVARRHRPVNCCAAPAG